MLVQTRPPEIWNFLFFIDVETSHKRVLEKRSVVHVVKSVLGGVIKGLIFLYFGGEERAPIFGTSNHWPMIQSKYLFNET